MGFFVGNPPVTDGIHSQKASNAENVRHSLGVVMN